MIQPVDFRVPPVDAVALETRVAELATRSIKKDAKRQGLEMVLSMIDLTTLEGMDTPGKVRALCRKAWHPLAGSHALPSCAAVCVYPDLVGVAVEALRGNPLHVAPVATAFPSGRASLADNLADAGAPVALVAPET